MSKWFVNLILWGAAAAVGATIVWTGFVKAVAPHNFRRHLEQLGFIPKQLLAPTVTASAAFEAAWGVALIIAVAPGVVRPTSVVLLAVLSIISWWGVKSGKAEDCGCYGGYIQPSIGQSIGLNAAYSAILLLAWGFQDSSTTVGRWQVWAVILAGLIAGALAEWTRRYENANGSPRFGNSPLKVGGRWRHSWARGATKKIRGEVLVALLGPDCPYCKQWIKIGNATIQSPELPKVVGIVGSTGAKRDEFVREYGIRFPLVSVSPSLMNRLARAVPTTVRVEDGVIRDIWLGTMPPEFVIRFRDAFFPGVSRRTPDGVQPSATT